MGLFNLNNLDINIFTLNSRQWHIRMVTLENLSVMIDESTVGNVLEPSTIMIFFLFARIVQHLRNYKQK